MREIQNERQIKLSTSWLNRLKPEFEKTYMQELRDFLKAEKERKKTIYPKGDQIFAALDSIPFEKVKVVIIGQDPYHGPGQAHGLSFSVPPGVDIPPSLQNIYKELEADLGIPRAKHGHLQKWAEQGVLLLNAVLSVEAHRAASHQGKGWEQFTDAIIRHLNEEREGLVFILWGSYAQKKAAFVDRKKHLVIESPHPSPLSAHRGFLGSKPFSKVNQWLASRGEKPIDWRVE